MSITLNQVLTIYIWFVLAVVLAILLLIARFYEQMSHEPTYYRAFMAPLLFFGLASARDASINQIGGDPLADGLWLIGGVMLISLCLYLFRLMTMKH